MKSASESYAAAGVDVTAGYKAVELMKSHVARTMVPGVLSGCKLIFRDALARRCGGDSTLSPSPEAADQLAAALTRGQLIALMEAVDGLLAALPRNMGHTLLLTLICSRLRAAAGK